MIACKNSPPPPHPVYSCTHSCAKTMVTDSMAINSNNVAMISYSKYGPFILKYVLSPHFHRPLFPSLIFSLFI
uniref:Uncharacterized protein n=1 Tax=Rhizophora mucronata TaxID=61149 RepID=A0A2P2P7U0_RHIMU